ncbi:MAG: type II toxin-antitoxin system VapC family toxin [Crocosphaera sp.]|nr:type II toxin-antitoxin system VapC family toxin [Crocosphaera sp.]
MKLLLDTHTFLWFIDDSPQLETTTKALLESDNDLLLSLASIWEIAIKVSVGKLQLSSPFERFIHEQAEDIPIISRDTVFDRYEIKRLW